MKQRLKQNKHANKIKKHKQTRPKQAKRSRNRVKPLRKKERKKDANKTNKVTHKYKKTKL